MLIKYFLKQLSRTTLESVASKFLPPVAFNRSLSIPDNFGTMFSNRQKLEEEDLKKRFSGLLTLSAKYKNNNKSLST